MFLRKLAVTLGLSLLLLAACARGKAAPTAVSTPEAALVVEVTATALQAETPAPAASLESVRLPMGYIPNVQFAPFYVAQERGYFRQAGFDVEFDYSFETDGVALVGAGKLPFAVVSGEQVLLARAQGLPVLYVTAWWQDFPVAVIADAGLGLQSPADLKGQTIGLPGLFGATYIGLVALLHEFGLQETDVTLEAIGFNQVEAFATGKHRVVVGYMTNEPIQLRHMGFDLTVFPVAEYVTLASNGIITNETYAREHPERVRAFVNAFLMGLRDVLDHPETAYEISMKYVEDLKPHDPVQMEVLETAMDAWRATDLGHASPEAWENMHRVLLDMKLLDAPLDVEAAYTNEFLPAWSKGWGK